MVANCTKENTTMTNDSKYMMEYYKQNCVTFNVRPQKEVGEAIKAYATGCGCSVQTLFLAAVKDYMDRGLVPDAVKRGRKKKEENK
jgi:hypothetical protein